MNGKIPITVDPILYLVVLGCFVAILWVMWISIVDWWRNR